MLSGTTIPFGKKRKEKEFLGSLVSELTDDHSALKQRQHTDLDQI